MSTITKEQLIEDLKASTQNSRGMFEIGEETICALMSLLTTPPAPVFVPEWTNKQCLEFLSIAFRHAEIKGDLQLDDIRLGVKMVNGSRAAMLQGAEPVSNRDELPDDFISMLTGRAKYLREKGEIKSPELLERAAAALQGENADTTAIPNGWKLVPIDPTKDMLRAGQSVVGFWLNTVHCYSKMLAAAPAAPPQEV
ncbi:hypothetical protein ABKT96_09870 [Enterobacter kobei]|uniref:hypothetical protein n=1 Tax=Enterobacter kobei TaxID=208224 RepID=UPI0032AFBF3F